MKGATQTIVARYSFVNEFIRDFSFRKACFVLVCIFFWPITLIYILCVYIPLIALRKLNLHLFRLYEQIRSRPELTLAMEISYKKSEFVRSFVIHISALQNTACRMWKTVTKTSFSMVLAWCLQIFLEILTAWNDKEKSQELLSSRLIREKNKREMSLTDLSELLAYEEMEDVYQQDLSRRVMRKVMHHYIPSNPFKATVLVHSAGPASVYGEEIVESHISKRREQEAIR